MDVDISRWFFEFLLRDSIDDRTLNALVPFLPLGPQPSSLKKTTLLRRLESEIAGGSVSLKVLELLERLEELDYRDGVAASESMKAAYCAVAVEHTVRTLEGEGEGAEARYFDAVKRVWRDRVGNMENAENSGLGSEELWAWKDDIEAAVWDAGVRGNLRAKIRENDDAAEAVRRYVEEEWEKVGPPFLTLASEALGEEGLKEVLGVDEIGAAGDQTGESFGGLIDAFLGLVGGNGDNELMGSDDDRVHDQTGQGVDHSGGSNGDRVIMGSVNDRVHDQARQSVGGSLDAVHGFGGREARDGDEELMELDSDRVHDQTGQRVDGLLNVVNGLVGHNGVKEIPKGSVLHRRKHVANRRSRGALTGTSRGAKIVDCEDEGVGTSCDKYDCPTTVEVDKVREALKSSSLELHAVVKDPLPDAMQFAETIASALGRREDAYHGPSVEDQSRVDGNVDAVNPSVVIGADSVQHMESNLEDQCPNHPNEVPKPNIMERNKTARTFEWDESVDASSEDSSNNRSRPQLPSPNRRVVTPLKKYGATKFATRRKIKRWSQVEEETLRTGVQKYGKGNWKVILNSYRDVFEERIEGDLKDKWRNMIRAGSTRQVGSLNQ